MHCKQRLYLGKGRKAVGGTRGIGDDEGLGIVAALVHAHHIHGGVILGGRCDHDSLGTRINMRLALHNNQHP